MSEVRARVIIIWHLYDNNSESATKTSREITGSISEYLNSFHIRIKPSSE